MTHIKAKIIESRRLVVLLKKVEQPERNYEGLENLQRNITVLFLR